MGFWQSSLSLLDYLTEYNAVLSFLGALLALGGALIARADFRFLGLAALVAGVLGIVVLAGGYYRVNNRVLTGFEGIEVLIPRELSKVRSDARSRELVVSAYGNGTRYKDLACGEVQKAFDAPGDNSVRLATRYSNESPAKLLAQYCPRVHVSDLAAQQSYFEDFARVLAAREQRNVSEIRMFDAAWTGDAPLDKGPTIAGCRISWALTSSPDTFFEVFLAMPRPAPAATDRCPERKTFMAHLTLSGKRPNALLQQTDYILMWETVWAPLRAELKRRNGGKPAPILWSKDPPPPEPWPNQPPPVVPPANAWPDPAIKIRDGHLGDGPG